MMLRATRTGWTGERLVQKGDVFEWNEDYMPSWGVPVDTPLEESAPAPPPDATGRPFLPQRAPTAMHIDRGMSDEYDPLNRGAT